MIPWVVLKKPYRNDLFGLTLGFFATVSQVVLIREALSISGGNEITTALSFFAWLVGVGLGAMAAWRLNPPGRTLALGLLAAPFITGGGFFTLRLHRLILDIPGGGDPSIVGLLVLLVAGLGAGGWTIGFLFTAMARALETDAKGPVSRLYATEALGSLIGGLAFAFLFAGRIPHLVAIGIGCSLLAAFATVQTPLSRSARVVQGCLALVLVIASIAGPFSRIDRLAEIRAFFLLGVSGEFVKSVDSAYSRLTLSRHEDQFQLFHDNRYQTAFPDPWERPVPIHLALVQHPNPKRVLIVGGGPSDRLDAALSHRVERVVLTYLDKQVHSLCRGYWPPSTVSALKDPRVEVVLDDGRRYLSKTKEKFDVIIVFARPALSGQACRYHTREFFTAVKNALDGNGSMTVFTQGGANLLAPEAARAASSEFATVRSVFPQLAIVPGMEITLHAASTKGVVSTDPAVLKQRYQERGVDTPFFSSRRFEALLDEGRVASVYRQLRQWPKTINTDSLPIVYLAGLQLWERSLPGNRSAGDATWTGALERYAWLWLVVPLLLWAGMLLVARRRGRPNRPTGAVFAIATTGAAGMAVEIVVIYVFQIASGQVYTGLALLVALFMAGLAMGAFIGRRYLSKGQVLHGVFADLGIVVLLVLTGPVLSASFDAPWIVAAWSALAGIVTGAAFPALLNLAAQNREKDERKAAPAIEAADHIGAAFGALITGVIWVPVYGITTTCLLFAVLKTASLLGQLSLKSVSSSSGNGKKNGR
jgi:spermidine synthase